jgi:hypothetical protein
VPSWLLHRCATMQIIAEPPWLRPCSARALTHLFGTVGWCARSWGSRRSASPRQKPHRRWALWLTRRRSLGQGGQGQFDPGPTGQWERVGEGWVRNVFCWLKCFFRNYKMCSFL